MVHGLLSGKYATLDEFPESRARTLHFSNRRSGVRHDQDGQEELTSLTMEKIKAVCEDAGIGMVDAAFGWVMHQPQVTSVLAGAGKPDQLVRNAAIAEMIFPDDFLKALAEATRPLAEVFGSQVDMWQIPGRIG